MVRRFALAFGLFLSYAGTDLIYDVWKEGLDNTSFFAIGFPALLLMGGVAITILATKRFGVHS